MSKLSSVVWNFLVQVKWDLTIWPEFCAVVFQWLWCYSKIFRYFYEKIISNKSVCTFLHEQNIKSFYNFLWPVTVLFSTNIVNILGLTVASRIYLKYIRSRIPGYYKENCGTIFSMGWDIILDPNLTYINIQMSTRRVAGSEEILACKTAVI